MVATGVVYAQSGSERRLEDHVTALTGPQMQGRRVGTDGHELAQNYVVKQFEAAGLKPAGTDGWFTPSTIVWNVQSARSTELRPNGKLLARGVDYRPLGFSDDIGVEADAVFVGYGISDPVAGWDDYAGQDVRGKIVVALSDAPVGDVIAEGKTSDDAKAATALSKGAAGFLLINAPRTHGDRPEQRPDELGRMRPSQALTGLSAGRMTLRAAEAMLAESGFDLSELQAGIDTNGAASFPLDLEIKMTLAVEREEVEVNNVVGAFAGTGPPVVLGAHYDHLGDGIVGSLWTGEPRVHPGADDNASGVSVVIEVARQLRDKDHRRPIVITATTGEEIGLRGARRLSRTIESRGAVYINLDMVGRLRNPGLRVLGLDRSPGLRKSVRDAAKSANVTIITGALYDSSSDHLAFAESGFDALHVTTGRHPDYHQPTDTADRLNLPGMRTVTQFVADLVHTIAR